MAHFDALFDIRGKTAIVTGASSGLGMTFAGVLAERGANVVLAARRTERLKQVAEKISQAGGTAFPVTCDVSDPDQVKAMVDASVEHLGRIDILVNNAGVASDGGMMPEKVPNEIFEEVVRVNLLGVWYCCREVGQRMLSDGKGGSVINIPSIAGLNGMQNFPVAYQATKAAVINLTRNLACSWADRGIRVNAIAPGWFPSEMTGPYLGAPVFLEHAKKMAPMGRIGDPSELAGVLLLLASGASSYVTGHTIAVDGGVSASMGLPFMNEELFKLFSEVMPGGLGQRIMPSQ
ncbi:MAG TPA: glucose 1-dehydrogenase [Candidatus Tectomicrobia bacterium]|nr:glucose 1-dehydrogenase [Candidatus Tectomicrobia bacterium]